jgi:hypothetical protein
MTRFQTLLEELSRDLALPEPQRGRVLEELAADLEDMYRAYRGEGYGVAESERLTVDRVYPGLAVAAELERLHRPLYQRLLARLTAGARSRVERFGLVVLSAVLLGATLAGLPLDVLLTNRSPFLVPVLVLGCGALLVALWCTHRLFLAGAATARDAARGLGVLLLLILAPPFVAAVGLVIDFYGAAGVAAHDPSVAVSEMVGLLRSAGVLLLSSLLISLVAALWWLVLRSRVVSIRAAAEALQLRKRVVLLDAARGRDVA